MSIYYLFKRIRFRRSPSEWMTNDLYHRREGVKEGEEDASLPDWLQTRKEMIFPKSCITTGQQLGKGHFGSVFKGHLTQGKAV